MKVQALENLNSTLQERLSSVSSLSPSPIPLSPHPVAGKTASCDTPCNQLTRVPSPADDVFGSQVSLWSDSSIQEQLDQLEFEKEESRAKYDELKVSSSHTLQNLLEVYYRTLTISRRSSRVPGRDTKIFETSMKLCKTRGNR